MLVVLIIGLIAALAVPTFVNTMRGQRLDSAAHTVAMACQQARYEAVFEARTCWYVVDIDKQEVRLMQEPATTNLVFAYEDIAAETNIIESTTAQVKGVTQMPVGVMITGVQIQDGTEQKNGVIGFPFYNNGVCEPFRVFLQGENEEVRALDVDMFTGKATVFTPL
jgi:Tfp pilus assembly protein FimT